MRLVGITVCVCQICLIDFAQLMLHLLQSLLEADDAGRLFGIHSYMQTKLPFELFLAETTSGRQICYKSLWGST